MPNYIKLIFAASMWFAVASPANAADLSNTEVKQFVDSLKSVQALGDKRRAAGEKDLVTPDELKPKPGELFKPYTNGVMAMKRQSPQGYVELEAITGKHGFSNAESWASVGDRVMLAYVATKSEEGNPGGLKQAANAQIPPEALAMMTPEQKAQVQSGMAAMKTVSEVPPADKAVVKPYIPSIEQALNQTGGTKTR